MEKQQNKLANKMRKLFLKGVDPVLAQNELDGFQTNKPLKIKVKKTGKIGIKLREQRNKGSYSPYSIKSPSKRDQNDSRFTQEGLSRDLSYSMFGRSNSQAKLKSSILTNSMAEIKLNMTNIHSEEDMTIDPNYKEKLFRKSIVRIQRISSPK